jgi:hypothetical protein
MLLKSTLAVFHAFLFAVDVHGLPARSLRRRQAGVPAVTFNPDPLSGFSDPTLNIADPAFATTINGPYQAPFASEVNKALVGPVDVLRSGGLNFGIKPNYTMPLYYGVSKDGRSYWYIATDTSDKDNAEGLGLNHSPKLRFAAQSQSPGALPGAESLEVINNTVAGREGMVDFSPVRNIVPGAIAPFPPQSVTPGGRGDDNYTPLVRLINAGGEVWNMPIIAGDVTEEYLNTFCDGVPEDQAKEFYANAHGKVVAICPRDSLVTIATTHGFSFSKSVLYFAMDSSDMLPAALDDATYAPRLANIRSGGDDGLFSGVERFFVNTNGYTNDDLAPGAPNNETHHPWRQGLDSAILGDGMK